MEHVTAAFVKKREKLKTKIWSKKKYEISLLLLIQKSNDTVLLKWLLLFCVCASLQDLECLQTGVSSEKREIHSSILKMIQCHGWDAPSLHLTYCLIWTRCCCGLFVSCWFLFIQHQSMKPEFQKLQKHHQIRSWSFWKSGSIDWYCMNRITDIVWTESSMDVRVNNDWIYMFGWTNPLKPQIEIVWNIFKHLYYSSNLKK